VDDEPVIADTLSIILSSSGFSTMTAYDGESALELARAVHPDLLIISKERLHVLLLLIRTDMGISPIGMSV